MVHTHTHAHSLSLSRISRCVQAPRQPARVRPATSIFEPATILSTLGQALVPCEAAQSMHLQFDLVATASSRFPLPDAAMTNKQGACLGPLSGCVLG